MNRQELLETVFFKTFFVHLFLNFLGIVLLVAYFFMPSPSWGYIAACVFVSISNCICFTVNSIVAMKMLYQTHIAISVYRHIGIQTATARGLQGHIQPSVDTQTQSSTHTYEYNHQPVFTYRFFLLSICTQNYTLFLACMYVLGGWPSPVPPLQYI